MLARREPFDPQFPDNQHVRKLIGLCRAQGITLERSTVPEQWLYHPELRTLYVWEPDLALGSLSYLVVVLAHELGHARDFDRHPQHKALVRGLHWSDTPPAIEEAAFVEGFYILKELGIPVSLEQYLQMIESPMDRRVRRRLEETLCCLLSPPPLCVHAVCGAAGTGKVSA